MKKYMIFVISIFVGIIFWIIMVKITGKTEAWEDSSYLLIGLPILGIVNIILGALKPYRPWRWGVLSTVSQIIPMLLLSEGDSKLWTLTIILLVLLSVPMVLSNYIGSFIKQELINSSNNN